MRAIELLTCFLPHQELFSISNLKDDIHQKSETLRREIRILKGKGESTFSTFVRIHT